MWVIDVGGSRSTGENPRAQAGDRHTLSHTTNDDEITSSFENLIKFDKQGYF